MTTSGLSVLYGYNTHCTKYIIYYKNFYKWSLNFGLPGVRAVNPITFHIGGAFAMLVVGCPITKKGPSYAL